MFEIANVMLSSRVGADYNCNRTTIFDYYTKPVRGDHAILF